MQLSDKLEIKFRLDATQKKALNKLSLFSVADLLFHFPVRYSDISEVKKIIDLIIDFFIVDESEYLGLNLRKTVRYPRLFQPYLANL